MIKTIEACFSFNTAFITIELTHECKMKKRKSKWSLSNSKNDANSDFSDILTYQQFFEATQFVTNYRNVWSPLLSYFSEIQNERKLNGRKSYTTSFRVEGATVSIQTTMYNIPCICILNFQRKSEKKPTYLMQICYISNYHRNAFPQTYVI